MTFHENCLLGRRFSWTVKPCYLWKQNTKKKKKKKKKNSKMFLCLIQILKILIGRNFPIWIYTVCVRSFWDAGHNRSGSRRISEGMGVRSNHITVLYVFGQTGLSKQCRQIRQSAASNQDLHCLLLTQQFYKHSLLVKWNFWKEAYGKASQIYHIYQKISVKGDSTEPRESSLNLPLHNKNTINSVKTRSKLKKGNTLSREGIFHFCPRMDFSETLYNNN